MAHMIPRLQQGKPGRGSRKVHTPLMVALDTSGYWVVLWLPQMQSYRVGKEPRGRERVKWGRNLIT